MGDCRIIGRVYVQKKRKVFKQKSLGNMASAFKEAKPKAKPKQQGEVGTYGNQQ